MSATTLLTVEQFLQLPQVASDDYRRYELWQGEIVEMGETVPFHNWVRESIQAAFRKFLQATGLGVALVETGIQIDTNNLHRPDVAIWDSQHWAAVDLHTSPVVVIPQLVVEIKSPSNTVAELLGKANTYLRSGVSIVWIVIDNPFKIHIFEAGGVHRVVSVDDVLEAPTLLPGFSADVASFLPAGAR